MPRPIPVFSHQYTGSTARIAAAIMILLLLVTACQPDNDSTPNPPEDSFTVEEVSASGRYGQRITPDNASRLQVAQRLTNGTLDRIIGFKEDEILMQGSRGVWRFSPDMSRSELMPDMQAAAFHQPTNQLAFFRDNHVYVMDLESGEYRLEGDFVGTTHILSLTFNTSGSLLALHSFQDGFAIWDIDGQTQVRSDTREGIIAAAFDDDDTFYGLVRIGDYVSRQFEVWDLSAGSKQADVEGLFMLPSVQLRPATNQILMTGFQQTGVWALDSGELLHEIDNAQYAWMPANDGRLLVLYEAFDRQALGLLDNLRYYTLGVYDLQHEQVVHQFETRMAGVTSIAFDAARQMAYIWSERDMTLYAYSLTTNTLVDAYPVATYAQWIDDFAFHSESGWLAYSQELNDTAHLINILDGTTLEISDPRYIPKELAFHPDGQTLVIGDSAAAIFWDIGQNKMVNIFSGYGGMADITFSPDGNYLVLASYWANGGSSQAFVRVLDYKARDLVIPDIETGSVSDVAHHPEKAEIAFASGRQLVIWDIDANRRVFSDVIGTEISSVAYMPDGQALLLGTSDGRLLRWTVSGISDPIFQAEDTSGSILALAIHPDGQLVALGSWGAIYLFDLAQQALLTTLTDHSGSVRNLQFSDDGSLLISSGTDGMLNLWTVR